MSRICVKNLPKYITEDRLKEHFSRKGDVTDAKLMRTSDGKSRQFAFVGYRTEEEAKQAIKFFDKSFLDTSRILCEVARKVGDPDIPRPWSRYSKEREGKLTDESNKVPNSKSKTKKKSTTNVDENDDPKLQEFLEVMQARSKSKLWANDLVAPALNQIGKGSKESTQSERQQVNKVKKLSADKTSQIEHDMHEEPPFKTLPVAHNEVVSDRDYFKSRVKKEWSDSDSETDDDDDDDNVIALEQDGEGGDDTDEVSECEENVYDASQGDWKKKDFEEHMQGLPEEIDGELMESENQLSNSQVVDEVLQTARLFVRNLPYAATEDELAELFKKFGNVAEVHLVFDKETKCSKGFAYVQYRAAEDASRALEELDHSIFQGRLLHVMPAKAKNSSQDQGNIVSDSKPKTLKQKREEERKASEAGGNTRAWNSLFMRSDTIVENIARKYGVSKSNLLDSEANDIAVRIALGETQIIAETKKALSNAGVNVASLEEFASGKTEGLKRSNHVLLIKNLPYNSTEIELSTMFGKFGSLDKIILPPTRTLALVIFLEPAEARIAFRGLSYKRYKDVPLYLEWAPSNILIQDMAQDSDAKNNTTVGEQEAKKVLLEQQAAEISEVEIDPDRVESRSLFVKNLNFKTTEECLRKHISDNIKQGKVLSVTIKKHEIKGKNVSMGYGFIEFDSVETAAHICRNLQGTVLDGYALILQLCNVKSDEKASSKVGNDRSSTKLIVRNVAFEATEKDLRQLFSPFGQVKSLRLPTRFGKQRGFAFVEFVTKQEAQNALKALSSTHLYGRHLVLERAKEGETLEELRKRTAAQFANDEEALQNPTKISKRRKITGLSG